MKNYKKLIHGVGVKQAEGQINKELAKQARLVPCGQDNEGDDLYIGNDQEWKEYERLELEETQELIDEKINQDFQEDMRSEVMSDEDEDYFAR